MNVTLLAHQMNTRCQQLGIVRTVRRMTVETVFADRRMVPKERSPVFGMAGVTDIVDGKFPQHLPCLTTVRVVAGSASDLCVAQLGAKQVSRTLVQSLSLLNVAS